MAATQKLGAFRRAIRAWPSCQCTYGRRTLENGWLSGRALREALSRPDSIVIDPDSRLDAARAAAGLSRGRYYFFESRPTAATADPLSILTGRWAEETFGIPDASPYVAVAVGQTSGLSQRGIAISLGVGENPAKRIADPFEADLLKLLAGTGAALCVDLGAGGEEAARVERVIAASGVPAQTWRGSFAGFAAIIARSKLYVGYDSAGQHVAAACGTPLISVFAGFPCTRMLARWRPAGHVIRVDDPRPEAVLAQVRSALAGFTAREK